MLSIRDPRAAELAKALAAKRKTTMTDAIIMALENELKRERESVPLAQRLQKISEKANEMAGPNRQDMTKHPCGARRICPPGSDGETAEHQCHQLNVDLLKQLYIRLNEKLIKDHKIRDPNIEADIFTHLLMDALKRG